MLEPSRLEFGFSFEAEFSLSLSNTSLCDAVSFSSRSNLGRLARKENVGNERPFAVMGNQCGPCVHRDRFTRLLPYYIAPWAHGLKKITYILQYSRIDYETSVTVEQHRVSFRKSGHEWTCGSAVRILFELCDSVWPWWFYFIILFWNPLSWCLLNSSLCFCCDLLLSNWIVA